MADFKQRVPLGRTGLNVGRIGLASGYGVPAAAIEKAYHEHGVNYLYVSPYMNLGAMAQAYRSLAKNHRDDLCIVLARPYFCGFGARRLEKFVDRWLRRIGLEWVDLLFQETGKPLRDDVLERVERLRGRGKVRFLGISSHTRPFLGKIASCEIQTPVDWFHTRYNAVHTGAEQDIFPHVGDSSPGIVVFTATCWRKLLKPKNMPAGETPPSARDCYRFVLSRPEVQVCLTGPSGAEQLDDNLKALEAGPLTDHEMDRMRRIGKHIYTK